jgi:hypothetical protein
MPRVTINQINKALAEAGVKAELVRDDRQAYHYFMGEDVSRAYSTSVLTPRTSTYTIEQWVTMAKRCRDEGNP